MDEDLRDDLVAIDRELGKVQIPAALERRILRPTAQPAPRWPLLLAALAVLVAVGAALWPRGPEPAPDVARARVGHPKPEPEASPTPWPPSARPAPVRERWGGSLRLESGCEADGDEHLQAATACRLVLTEPALELEVLEHARLRPARRGVGIEAGLVMVSVEHLEDPAEPVRVEVVGGTIEVTGTRFLVAQGERGGYVHLLEGSITFVPKAGAPMAVVIGEPLRWGPDGALATFAELARASVSTEAAPEAAPDAAPEAEVARPSPARPSPASRAAPVGLDVLLDQVADLRRRAEHRDAVAVLRRARARINTRSAREILSFEEGTLREHYQRDSAVCRYWRGHLARFSGGRYDAAIEHRLAGRQCPKTIEPTPE